MEPTITNKVAYKIKGFASRFVSREENLQRDLARLAKIHPFNIEKDVIYESTNSSTVSGRGNRRARKQSTLPKDPVNIVSTFDEEFVDEALRVQPVPNDLDQPDLSTDSQ